MCEKMLAVGHSHSPQRNLIDLRRFRVATAVGWNERRWSRDRPSESSLRVINSGGTGRHEGRFVVRRFPGGALRIRIVCNVSR